MKRKTVYVVKWEDACKDARWKYTADINQFHGQPQLCYSVGIIVRRSKSAITLATTLADNKYEEYGGFERIPIGCIKSIRKLGRIPK